MRSYFFFLFCMHLATKLQLLGKIGIINFQKQQLPLYVESLKTPKHENTVTLCVNIVTTNNPGNKLVPKRANHECGFLHGQLQQLRKIVIRA